MEELKTCIGTASSLNFGQEEDASPQPLKTVLTIAKSSLNLN
jgi:hypothetical protein